ncbi:two-component system catabolic regulation response regulator CreB [Haloferula luteola]|uniref:Two-component system catabolic regulation response regulator CreB n=1 Tax=Haloferula luteola TaxID=595692 RepID=A0A840VAU8_9BACT|nr:two-component system response regulator CreB [Haloferula luteola]MBB5351808.1 two-component system catabolic regulation response regulator CreB [Haloferula luteola]
MPRILLVEDEPSIADTLVYALRTECLEVAHSLTGKGALDLHAEKPFDFIILDIGLPDMTGLEVCKKLREDSSVPILFLTARDGEIDRILGLELGGDDYVTKPFSPREVVARVRAILRRTESHGREERPTALKLEPLHSPTTPLAHDEATMRVLLHGDALDLTAHEYKLLLVFLKRPHRVFTRDQLLDLAWDDPGAVTDRTIDAHIKTIRAKLRDASPGAESLIETRRGLGYAYQP